MKNMKIDNTVIILFQGCIAESVDAGTLRDIIGTSLLHVAARTNDLTAATKLVSELGADIKHGFIIQQALLMQ